MVQTKKDAINRQDFIKLIDTLLPLANFIVDADEALESLHHVTREIQQSRTALTTLHAECQTGEITRNTLQQECLQLQTRRDDLQSVVNNLKAELTEVMNGGATEGNSPIGDEINGGFNESTPLSE